MTTDDFDDVLATARAGDDRAWGQIYDEFAPRVLAYLRLRGASDPENVLGEVFVHVVEGLPDFSGDHDGFAAWIFTIAHRRTIDEHRRRSRRPIEVSDEAVHAEPAPATPAEVEVVERLRTDDVLELLTLLTEDQREALALRVVLGMELSQIAAIMDRTSNAVKSLQRRGIRALRRHLQGHDQ